MDRDVWWIIAAAAIFIFCIYAFFRGSSNENFEKSDPTAPAATLPVDNIDVTQNSAVNILKELAKDPNRYNGFFNSLDVASSKVDAKYPLMWPLSAGNINNRLAFAPTKEVSRWPLESYFYKNLMVTESPPTDEYIWFTGNAGNIRVYSPSNPSGANNYLSGWNVPLQLGMCSSRGGGGPEQYAGPRYGASCAAGCDTLTKEITNPFSFATQSNTKICGPNQFSFAPPGTMHCHDTNEPYLRNAFDQHVKGFGNRNYPYIDPNSLGCKWKTDQEAYACCTTFNGDGRLKDRCGPAFMPSDHTGASQCQPFMMALCESNWESNACLPYLDSWKHNSDVGDNVKQTVANYINGMSLRAACTYEDDTPGTNDYTTPLLGTKGVCKLNDGSGDRDDSKDEFINRTMITLCSKTSEGGVCDDILQQYCAQFTRHDLDQDDSGVLQKLCGCHLAVSGQGPVQKCEGSGAPPDCLTGISPLIQPDQYTYPGTPLQCDPICVWPDTIQRDAPPCTQSVCIMENVNVNLLNSGCKGDIKISQVCGDDATGTKTGNCYMNNVDVGLINSSCGGVFLDQQCNACFTFPPNKPWETTLVPCCDPSNKNGGLCRDPVVPPPNGPPPNGPGAAASSSFMAWLKKYGLSLGAGVGVIGILVVCIAIIVYYTSNRGA